ncbi:hypothetical protein BV509_20095 [Rhodovulum sulfidophilum]|uniref:LysR family transcriptional regulator n=1 Tax=Rhodovulum visakhapatnamense TaxID=364297 RepID=A0ABS1RD91_9RHOB|nr:LysR substrate-binding domain-containing protein [Rhodovulum visakhapatnamense]MBL3571153.1 LysR family transcriptional regulator [Rhodovulum visakhapatnamense]MBL3577588.1 LysR family transcriptional regulator [Rhodovulum visakhapatnamense]OLS46423.1 hypothetical protein BV509_20095 [Rhodovulum sulfidophilum]
MNYPQIRAFHLVAKEGSVRRAAELLGVSQPTISQHLKGLETRHGVRLFEKRGRGLVPTEAGERLFSVTLRLTELVNEIDDLLEQRPRAATGRLRIHADSPGIAVRLVSRLRASHPRIEVTIQRRSTEAIAAALLEMRADVGIAVEPMVDPALLILPYRYEELRVCLPATSPLAQRRDFALDAISGQTLIQRESGSRTRALVERTIAIAGKTPASVLEIEGSDVVREAVACGLGMTFFAESDCLPDPRVVYLRLAPPQRQIGFSEHIMLRRDRRRVVEIAAFLSAAALGEGEPAPGVPGARR